MPESARRATSRSIPLLSVAIGLLVAAAALSAAWQLVAGSRLATAGQWTERAQDWQSVLMATAETIEDETLRPAEGGGYVVPWEEGDGPHPFPIRADDVLDEIQGMTIAYPLPLVEHDAAARRVTESHAYLREQLAGLERLGPLATLKQLPPALRTAAVDIGGLLRPVTQHMAEEAAEAGWARLAAAAAGLACAALLLVFFVRATRLRAERDRLRRYVAANRPGPQVPGAGGA